MDESLRRLSQNKPFFSCLLTFLLQGKGKLASSPPMISVYTLFSVKSGYATVISVITPRLLIHVTCLFNHEVPHSHDAHHFLSRLLTPYSVPLKI